MSDYKDYKNFHKFGYINCYLYRLILYYSHQDWIVTGDLPTKSRYWEQLQVSMVFPGNRFLSFLSSQLSFDNFKNVE